MIAVAAMAEMMSVEDYREFLLNQVAPTETINLPIAQAHGLVSAELVEASCPLPPFDSSAMDGFAVTAQDTAFANATMPVRLTVIDDIPAGGYGRERVTPGTCARIMTGAPIPQGADAVVRVEDTDVPAGATPLRKEISVYAPVSSGKNIRAMGEAANIGEPVIAPGSFFDARAVAAAASVNTSHVRVYRKPKVTVVATGSELVDPGTSLVDGQIPDSNSLLLAGLLREWGADVECVRRIRDSVEDLRAVLEEASLSCDLIVTSGGVSAGAFDIVKDYGETRGFSFPKVAMQPGKPQACGKVGNALVIGLPGNPVSVWVSALLFVRPALQSMAGMRPEAPRIFDGVAGTGWKSPTGRRQYVPSTLKVERSGNRPVVMPVHRLGSGSHVINAVQLADSLCVVPAEVECVERGDRVQFLQV
ncbi:molybdopterin molybdotransferase MoeA [Actinomycetaceae bacterium WB03_NA08]|uniref:Molybdopterin molybdenumtransferase n=1 Tax=Scrofimicrobium canadense TaxID=2652290 RepID=A0A6N7W740_9ACTO|nr:gephyrin-like molybdotransferase Glp [Scrofimicrobium canadense]MSS85201.1 molybdopterin molybdotransferase MoeA [Scrofimicrobium canadense]